jgi:hypothetical protein
MQSFIELIEQLMLSNSPAAKLNALYEFLRNEPDFLSKEEQDSLISKFKIAKEAKSKAGLNDVTKRWKEKKAKGKALRESKWLFLEKSPYGKQCVKCNERYEIDDPIFLRCEGKTEGNKGYHPDCAPEEAKADEKASVFYNRFLKKEQGK